jgi:DNA polymerase/3'-5' exonuclease PolX
VEIIKEKEHESEVAKKIAVKVANDIRDITTRIEIVGSIRRGKAMVHDIDLVVIPKNAFTFSSDLVRKIPAHTKIIKQGDKMIQFEYEGIQIDVYIANEKNYEVLRLIRTGSSSHNVRLCTIAKSKGWVLHADGRGLYIGDKMIDNTEKGILEKLLGKWVEPKNRE